MTSTCHCRSAEQIRNKLPKLASLISNMMVAFCKIPTSAVAFQKIPTTVTPQLILARLYTRLKEVKVVVKTPALLKKLIRHFLTLMTQPNQKKQVFFYFYVCIMHLLYSFYFNQQCTIYIFYFNNIYTITTPTCFDTFVTSSGSSKVVLR